MAAFLAAVVLLSEECGARRGPSELAVEASLCPARSSRDDVRENQIRALLATAPEGRQLLADLDGPLRICFGEALESGIRPDGTVTLDPRAGDGECAARLGHLIHHAVVGSPLAGLDDPSRDCERVVAEAVEAEAHAHALEIVLRQRFGVEDPVLVYPFEAEVRRVPETERAAVISAYFLAEPRRGGASGLVRAYRRRCQDDRRERE